MSLQSFWKKRLPTKGNPDATGRGAYFLDTYHSYITAYTRYPDDDEDYHYDHQVVYGELRVCENINIRRAPIPTHLVTQVKYRMPYNRCEKCKSDVDYLRRMSFGEIVVME